MLQHTTPRNMQAVRHTLWMMTGIVLAVRPIGHPTTSQNDIPQMATEAQDVPNPQD